jgi:DNA-binding NarL/FixJ family response regulator
MGLSEEEKRQVKKRIEEALAQKPKPRPRPAPRPHRMPKGPRANSRRNGKILGLYSEGLSLSEIARRMKISVSRVRKILGLAR